MSISRRIFLRSGTMSAVGAGVALGAAKLALGQKGQRLSATIMPKRDTLFSYSRAAFEPCVGSVFEARGSLGNNIKLTLISINGFNAKAIAAKMSGRVRDTETFSLNFKANQKLTKSGIPTLNHPVLGKFDLFLTAENRNGEFFYEAVVNHVI
jgi:hypothetical protein